MAGFISFNYKCTTEDCKYFDMTHNVLHKRDKEQCCKNCKEPLKKVPAGTGGSHISWSMWRAM